MKQLLFAIYVLILSFFIISYLLQNVNGNVIIGIAFLAIVVSLIFSIVGLNK